MTPAPSSSPSLHPAARAAIGRLHGVQRKRLLRAVLMTHQMRAFAQVMGIMGGVLLAVSGSAALAPLGAACALMGARKLGLNVRDYVQKSKAVDDAARAAPDYLRDAMEETPGASAPALLARRAEAAYMRALGHMFRRRRIGAPRMPRKLDAALHLAYAAGGAVLAFAAPEALLDAPAGALKYMPGILMMGDGLYNAARRGLRARKPPAQGQEPPPRAAGAQATDPAARAAPSPAPRLHRDKTARGFHASAAPRGGDAPPAPQESIKPPRP